MSSSKLKTKLEVNDLKISRSSPVSFREIAETSRKVTNLSYFSYLELPWVAVAQSAKPLT